MEVVHVVEVLLRSFYLLLQECVLLCKINVLVAFPIDLLDLFPAHSSSPFLDQFLAGIQQVRAVFLLLSLHFAVVLLLPDQRIAFFFLIAGANGIGSSLSAILELFLFFAEIWIGLLTIAPVILIQWTILLEQFV